MVTNDLDKLDILRVMMRQVHGLRAAADKKGIIPSEKARFWMVPELHEHEIYMGSLDTFHPVNILTVLKLDPKKFYRYAKAITGIPDYVHVWERDDGTISFYGLPPTGLDEVIPLFKSHVAAGKDPGYAGYLAVSNLVWAHKTEKPVLRQYTDNNVAACQWILDVMERAYDRGDMDYFKGR